MLRKLKVLADHPSTDEATREAAQRKLDKYSEEFGIDQSSLEEPSTAVGLTRREMVEKIIETILSNHTHKKAKACIRAALNYAYNDSELEDTFNQVKGIFK
jgi:predicted nucleic-acid-binding protein